MRYFTLHHTWRNKKSPTLWIVKNVVIQSFLLKCSEEAFKAFVKALVRTVPNLSDLVRVDGKHHPHYYELVGRISKTDYLIDQIVYQLYGLTKDEIAIVEGEE